MKTFMEMTMTSMKITFKKVVCGKEQEEKMDPEWYKQTHKPYTVD